MSTFILLLEFLALLAALAQVGQDLGEFVDDNVICCLSRR